MKRATKTSSLVCTHTTRFASYVPLTFSFTRRLSPVQQRSISSMTCVLGNMQVNVGERQGLQICAVDVLCQCLPRMELYLEQLKPLNTTNNSSIALREFSSECVLSLSLSVIGQ